MASMRGRPQVDGCKRMNWLASPPAPDPWHLVEYTYELIDHERDSRRALHLHNADWFVQTYRVVVHEHCERPIGTTHCDHFAGTPVRDGYEALDRLMETWTHDDPVDCTSYACLE